MLIDNFFPRLKLIALPLATSLFFLGAPLAIADDMFVQIANVQGEALDKEFQGAVKALSWSWGMDQSSTAFSTAGRTGSAVKVQELSFTHFVDRATPKLMEYCATGKHISDARLTLRTSGSDRPISYVVIDLKSVVVNKIAMGGDPSSGRSIEQVSLSFAAIQFTYKSVDATGRATGDVRFGWDIAANKSM
jgi:type VI secretion system secreted protein Hcp